MSKNKITLYIAFVCLCFGASSCRKYLNVNTNPNISQTATVQTLLPAAQLYVGSSVGVDLQVDGSFWAQYWTQSISASQYHILDTYDPGQDEFLHTWTDLYSGAENFFQLYKLADSQKQKQYAAIALLMQAYTFQLITDGWGDVPFTQALKGQFADGNMVNPKYDSQMVVYNGIIAYIDSANNLINPNDPLHPGADDLIYGGNMAEWQKFSNTLMLKVLLRMSMINPSAAQAGIAALYANPNTNFFIANGDEAKIGYGYNSANNSPLYAEAASTQLGGTQNLIGSATCIDSMNSNHDPRVNVFYEIAPNTITTSNPFGSVVGLRQGLFSGNYNILNYSVPSFYVAGDAHNSASASAPVNLMTSWESYFLQAEAAARGWSGGNDAALFLDGIQASFNYYSTDITASTDSSSSEAAYNAYINGVTGTSGYAPGYWTAYPTSGTSTQKLRFIITQKWFAMCGNQAFEAWSEWRRTGYPDFLVQSATGVGAMPRRFLYPTTESTTNANFPGVALITKSVWWDIH